MYKIIFFDLDGTLLDEKKEVLEESKMAIEKVKKSGVEVVLCSGRQKNAVERYKRIADTGRYIISTNGAEIYDFEAKKVILEIGMAKNASKWLCEIALRNKYLLRVDTKIARYINNLKYRINDEILLEEDLEKFIDNNQILQISIGTKEEKEIDQIIKKLKGMLAVKIINKYYVTFNGISLWIINVANEKVSKGNAVLYLCQYLNINSKEAMAFGDGKNDISMLKAVGCGIAMGNASTEVKKVAREVIGINEDASIAKALNKFIINNTDSKI